MKTCQIKGKRISQRLGTAQLGARIPGGARSVCAEGPRGPQGWATWPGRETGCRSLDTGTRLQDPDSEAHSRLIGHRGLLGEQLLPPR